MKVKELKKDTDNLIDVLSKYLKEWKKMRSKMNGGIDEKFLDNLTDFKLEFEEKVDLAVYEITWNITNWSLLK